jgi:hypothetical protein
MKKDVAEFRVICIPLTSCRQRHIIFTILKKYLQSEGMLNQQNNLITNKDLELQIKTFLQNAPRDPDKLERLLRLKKGKRMKQCT